MYVGPGHGFPTTMHYAQHTPSSSRATEEREGKRREEECSKKEERGGEQHKLN